MKMIVIISILTITTSVFSQDSDKLRIVKQHQRTVKLKQQLTAIVKEANKETMGAKTRQEAIVRGASAGSFYCRVQGDGW